MLVHGGTATSQAWASHLPAFTEHFQVFAPDSRGHGRTDNPTGELGYRVMADDVAALVGALGLQRPLVLGYSDGGQIALELGIRYPGLARALVLGGTQFRFSEAYLEDARALLGIAEGEEVDEEGAVEPNRQRIENFMRRWRSRYEGNRVFRVLAPPV